MPSVVVFDCESDGKPTRVRTVRVEPAFLHTLMHFEPFRTHSNAACAHTHTLLQNAHVWYGGNFATSQRQPKILWLYLQVVDSSGIG